MRRGLELSPLEPTALERDLGAVGGPVAVPGLGRRPEAGELGHVAAVGVHDEQVDLAAALPVRAEADPGSVRGPARGGGAAGEGQLHQAGAVGVHAVNLELAAMHEAGEDDLAADRPARLDAE